MLPTYHVYILRCRDGSYYVGQTNELETRLSAHERGEIEGHTKERRPVRCVYVEAYECRDDAFRRERQLKGWSRAKKEALIAGNYDRLKFLSRSQSQSLSAR